MKVDGLLYFKDGRTKEISIKIFDGKIPLQYSVSVFETIETTNLPGITITVENPQILFLIKEFSRNIDSTFFVSYTEP